MSNASSETQSLPVQPRSRLRSALVNLLKAAITASVVAFIIHKMGWRSIVETVREAQYSWLIAAALVFFVSGVLGALQWRLLLKNKGVSLSFFRAMSLYFIGMFFNNFVFGMVAGDAMKLAYLKADRNSMKAGLAATFLDRFAGLWAMAGFAIAGSLALFRRGLFDQGRLLTAGLALAVTFAGFCAICVFIVSHRAQQRMFTLLKRAPIPGKERLIGLLRAVVLEAHDRRVVAPVAVLSAVIQFMRIGVHMLCAASLGLVTAANFQYFFVFVPMLAVLMLVPLPFGLKEGVGGALFLLAGFGPEAPEAPVVMEFLASLTGIGVSMSGGVFFLFAKVRTAEWQESHEALDCRTPAQRT